MSKSIRSIIAPNGKVYLFDNEAFKKEYKRYVEYEALTRECSKEEVKTDFLQKIYKSESTVKNWLSGRNGVDSFETLQFISKVLNVSPYHLLIEQKNQNYSDFHEPSIALVKALETMMRSFDKSELYLDFECYHSYSLEHHSDSSKALFFRLPINQELIEHFFEIILVIELYYRDIDWETREGAGARVYMQIDYGGRKKYIHNIATYSKGLGEWEELLKEKLKVCEERIEYAHSFAEQYERDRVKYEETLDKFRYFSYSSIKHDICDYLGIDVSNKIG